MDLTPRPLEGPTIRLEPLEKPVVYVSALFSAKDIARVTECLVSNSIN